MWELEKHYPKIFQVIHSVLVNLWSKTLGNNFNTLGRLLTKVNYCFEVRFKWFHLGFEITLNPVMYKVMTAKPQCCPKCSGVEHTTRHYFPLGTHIQCPFYPCFPVFSMQLRTSWLVSLCSAFKCNIAYFASRHPPLGSDETCPLSRNVLLPIASGWFSHVLS